MAVSVALWNLAIGSEDVVERIMSPTTASPTQGEQAYAPRHDHSYPLLHQVRPHDVRDVVRTERQRHVDRTYSLRQVRCGAWGGPEGPASAHPPGLAEPTLGLDAVRHGHPHVWRPVLTLPWSLKEALLYGSPEAHQSRLRLDG